MCLVFYDSDFKSHHRPGAQSSRLNNIFTLNSIQSYSIYLKGFGYTQKSLEKIRNCVFLLKKFKHHAANCSCNCSKNNKYITLRGSMNSPKCRSIHLIKFIVYSIFFSSQLLGLSRPSQNCGLTTINLLPPVRIFFSYMKYWGQ